MALSLSSLRVHTAERSDAPKTHILSAIEAGQLLPSRNPTQGAAGLRMQGSPLSSPLGHVCSLGCRPPSDFGGHMATADDTSARQAAWVRDEIILALDLYIDQGCLLGGALPEARAASVVALSDELRALPIHPPSGRHEPFRNPKGVALKLANFRAAERDIRMDLGEPGADDLPIGMSAYSRTDRAVMTEFFGRWEAVAVEAAAIRAGSASTPPSTDQPASAVAQDAPIDGGGVVTYESSSSPGGMRSRAEADLVKRYADHMSSAGHDVTGRHYRASSEARLLRADLFLRDLNVLVEAKATVARNDIRLAIGQLLDYRRFESTAPDMAVLLPDRPGDDMLELLGDLSIACVWPVKNGYRDTCQGHLTR